jgi:hypothetical protein
MKSLASIATFLSEREAPRLTNVGDAAWAVRRRRVALCSTELSGGARGSAPGLGSPLPHLYQD